MKLIIEIPDDVYNDISNLNYNESFFPNTLIWAVRNGTPIVTESERQKRALAIVDALTEKHLINVMERGCLRRSILLEPERPQGDLLKAFELLKTHCKNRECSSDCIFYREMRVGSITEQFCGLCEIVMSDDKGESE